MLSSYGRRALFRQHDRLKYLSITLLRLCLFKIPVVLQIYVQGDKDLSTYVCNSTTNAHIA